MAEVETTTPSQAVVVQGTPVGANEPTEQGKALTERMNALEETKVQAENSFANRLADSDLGFYDDVIANKRYITKLAPGEVHTVLGTPTHQIRRLPWPTADDVRLGGLAGILVLREDGTFFSIPQGIYSLAEVIDPVSGDPLVGDVDPKREKARQAAAGGDVTLAGEQKDTQTTPKAQADKSKGNKK